MMSEEGAAIRDSVRGYEEKDISLKAVGVTVMILVIAVVASAILLHPLFGYHAKDHQLTQSFFFPASSPVYETKERFPEPRLQAIPRKDLRVFREEENHLLNTYGWTDKSQGFIRVPIEEAMGILLKRGLPIRGQNDEE